MICSPLAVPSSGLPGRKRNGTNEVSSTLSSKQMKAFEETTYEKSGAMISQPSNLANRFLCNVTTLQIMVPPGISEGDCGMSGSETKAAPNWMFEMLFRKEIPNVHLGWPRNCSWRLWGWPWAVCIWAGCCIYLTRKMKNSFKLLLPSSQVCKRGWALSHSLYMCGALPSGQEGCGTPRTHVTIISMDKAMSSESPHLLCQAPHT